MPARRRWRDRFPMVLVLIAALLVPACTGTPGGEEPPSTATAAKPADADGVVKAHDALMSALRAGDGDALAALLDREPGLLLFHPRFEPRFDDVAEVRAAFARMMARTGPIEWTDVHRSVRVHGEVGWHTSHLAIESDDLAEPFLGRASEIWVKRPQGWRLVHAHWSENPL